MCQKNYNRNLLTQNLTLTQGKFVGCEGAGSILKGAILGGGIFRLRFQRLTISIVKFDFNFFPLSYCVTLKSYLKESLITLSAA